MFEENVTFKYYRTLEELNDLEASKRLPTTVYLCILMSIGVIGNILVLYIFGSKYKNNNYRTFTLFLASIDLTACFVYFPAEIVDQTYPYMFYSEVACKSCRFIGRLTILGSALVLVVIAIERHRKVCYPFQKQISHSMACVFCGIALVVSLLFSWPVIIIEGLKVKRFDGNVTGYDCGTSDVMRKTKYPFMYTVLMFVVFSVVFLVIIVLYTFIIRRIKVHSKTIKAKSNEHSKKRRSVTRIMLFISIGYILSYLPHFILEIISTAKRGHVAPPTPVVLATLPLINRSFLITTVINPFILLIADSSFRKYGVDIFKIFPCCSFFNKDKDQVATANKDVELNNSRRFLSQENEETASS